MRAIRATLTTLGQPLPEGIAENLAASLPMETTEYLTGAVDTDYRRFDWQAFVARVVEVEHADPADAAYNVPVLVDLHAAARWVHGRPSAGIASGNETRSPVQASVVDCRHSIPSTPSRSTSSSRR